MIGKVDSVLTAQHIGEPNRKRPANNDPYGAGEQSGKHAKPDVRSVVANEQARAAEQRARTQPALKAPSASQPTPTTLPPTPPLPRRFPSPAHTPDSHSTRPGCTIPTIPITQCPNPLTLILREPLWLLHIIALTHSHHKCNLDNMYYVLQITNHCAT